MYEHTQKQSVKSPDYRTGFTIVELLIVIVIIGILASIIIVAYNGIQNRASSVALQSDLRNSQNVLEIDKLDNTTYPASLGLANGGKGLAASGGTTYQYTYTSATNSYCLTATSNRTGVPQYNISSLTGVIQEGFCAGHTGPIGGGGSTNGGVVTTLAGSGTSGFTNATGTSARFANPFGVAVDSSGNVFVADRNNHRIRRVTPAGVVTTFAGSGTSGFTNATGTAAQFSSPIGIAVNSSGTVYVADSANNRIRSITSGGVVSTLAGSGSAGSTNATGTSASFSFPTDVAVDSAGNVYVADYGNNMIRKITSAGVVTTLAGNGSSGQNNGAGASATFSLPTGLTVDSAGNVYVADTANHLIRKITTAGVVSTLAGGGGGFADGTGSAAGFLSPNKLTVDSNGDVYVADTDNHAIRKVTSTGIVTTVAGTTTTGFVNATGTAARFNLPAAITVDSSGVLYVADYLNHSIRKIQ